MKIPVIRAFERVPSPTLQGTKSAGYRHGIYLLNMSVKTTVALCSRRETRIAIFLSCTGVLISP